MPGPVSDSFDPEWGTGDTKQQIDGELGRVYQTVAEIIGAPPINIRELVAIERTMENMITFSLPEKDWRLIRFAIERAREAL